MEKKSNSLNFYIEKLIQKKDLTSEEATQAMRIIMSVEALLSEKAAFLISLQKKGPTIEEIASFAFTIRQMAKQVELKDIKKDKVLADTCGTGGGTLETFNISTTIMFILSAAGIVIAKHGNRAITSKCGSADVLEQLGININMEPAKASRCLSRIGIAFLFAPLYHSAFRNVQGVRREIKTPTVFNILGPLLNPAFTGSSKQGLSVIQILGVNDPKLIRKLAGVLKMLNLSRAMVVYGQGRESGLGMDEISTLGDTQVAELMDTGKIKDYKINPRDLGIKLANPSDLTGGTSAENAQILLDILSGKEKGAKRDIVLINAAAGLYLGGKAKDLKQGIKQANDCIDSGSALEKLDLLRQMSCQT